MTEVTELVELSADAAGLSRQDRLAQLRRQIASIPSRGDTSFSGPSVSVAGVSGTSAAAFESVADRGHTGREPRAQGWCSPSARKVSGHCYRRAVWCAEPWCPVEGAASLLLGLVASVTASGGHVAVIGQPRLGLLAAYEMGCATGTSGAHSGAWAGSGRDRCCAARRYGSGDSGIGGCVGIPVACASGGGARPEQGLDSCCHRRSLGRGPKFGWTLGFMVTVGSVRAVSWGVVGSVP